MEAGQTRAIEATRALAAAPERVWAALTEPAQLAAWYAEEAEVEPRAGGRYRARWGEGVEGTSLITVWEPPSRLVLTHDPPEGSDSPEARLPQPITEDFTLSPRAPGTTLRVTQRHIPDDPAWDAYYEAEAHGWQVALAALAAHVEDSDAVPRAEVSSSAPLPASVAAEQAWALLVGEAGLRLDDVRSREPFDVVLATGERLRGLVWSRQPPLSLMARVDDPGPAYLSVAVDAHARTAQLRWSCYGWSRAALDALRDRWAPWVPTVLDRGPAA